MKCVNHPTTEAVLACDECGKPFCGACAIQLGGQAMCMACLEGIVRRSHASRAKRPWRKIVAGLLSIVPGAGHMFLGAVGKGFSLMSILFLAVFLIILYSDSTGMYWMTAYLIPTLSVLFLCYAVFDSMAIADGERDGRKPAQSGDDTLRVVWERALAGRRTIAWIILMAGVVGILNIFSGPLAALTRTYLSLEIPIAGLVLPVILVVFGVYMLRKGRGRS